MRPTSSSSHCAPPPLFHETVTALRDALDAGIEPTDEELEMLALFRHPDAERELAQLFYRRALVREERLEREEAAARRVRRALAVGDDDSDSDSDDDGDSDDHANA